MKKETNHFSLSIDHEVYLNNPENPKRFLILLHGYLLDGNFMLKKFSRYIKDGYQIIAPNGPYLIPFNKDGSWEPRYSWYFYDSQTDDFFINPINACNYVTYLEKKYNTLKLPVDIIGYSQGGFFAPKLCETIENVQRVIGVSCILKSSRFKIFKDIEYHQVHGIEDDTVSYKDSKHYFEEISSQVDNSSFTTIECDHLLHSSLIKACHNILESN